MTYDWNQPIMSGTIICSNYNDFENKVRQGLFMVLYDEQNDGTNIDKKNVIAVKISTQPTCITNYSVEIPRDKNEFLDKSCIVCCSKMHLLHKENQVYKIIGRIDTNTYKKIYKVINKFISETNRQLVDAL